jgi:hypothetical protein
MPGKIVTPGSGLFELLLGVSEHLALLFDVTLEFGDPASNGVKLLLRAVSGIFDGHVNSFQVVITTHGAIRV